MNRQLSISGRMKYWVVILFTALAVWAYGQSENVYSYSITEGLPQSQVFAICQDSFG
jgi:hypothetical protein